jgi:hypothetical protein
MPIILESMYAYISPFSKLLRSLSSSVQPALPWEI